MFIVLAGWPAAEPPPGAWTASLGPDVPVALASGGGPGSPVSAATSADGRMRVLVAGALANRRELDATVGRSGGVPGERSDAAIVARLYEGRGEQGVSALRGGFAIALFDGRRGRLVLARDQLGVQPLCYAAGRGHCAAATGLGPLLRIPELAGAPDVATVDVVLALGAVPAPATPYPGIRQVAPGEVLVWEPGRVRQQRYWQLRFPEERDSRRTVAWEGARRAREQLEEAVRQRTTGVVTGMLLSGGIGAASVFALAERLGRKPAAAVTVRTGADETIAVAMATRAGVEHEVLRPEVDWVAAADDSLVVHGGPTGGMDEVLLAPAIAALAGRARVLLAGSGGASALGGGQAELAWAACDRYRALPGMIREGADILVTMGWPPALARIVRAARSAPVDVFDGFGTALAIDRRLELYAPALRRALAAGPTRRALAAIAGEAAAQGASEAQDVLFAIELATAVPRDTARVLAAAPREIDLWFPLADPRIVQTAAAIPPRARVGLVRRARLLVRALGADLPREVRSEPHRPLEPPPAAWGDGSLRALVEETLAPERVTALGLFDPEAVARLRMAHERGHAALGAVVWRLVLISRWLERPSRALVRHSSAPAETSAVMASSS